MKKICTLFIMVILVLCMTQCKKKVETIAPSTDELVYITLHVENDSKDDVNTLTGEVTYTVGDEILVGNAGAYRGSLTYDGTSFTGSIIAPLTSDYLHFFFVGNLPLNNVHFSGDKYVDFSDQSEGVRVLSYGHTGKYYTNGEMNYKCVLKNKCALVKFVTAIGTCNAVTISGLCSKAIIDFEDNEIKPSNNPGDPLTLYAKTATEKWAILLPSEQINNPTVTIDGFTASIESIPALTNNMFYTSGVNISMEKNADYDYKFTVNDSGKQVYFSKGNLQYRPYPSTWRLAPNQFDYGGEDNFEMYFYEPGMQDENWYDLFGWGTGDNPMKVDLSGSAYTEFVDWGTKCGTLDGHNDWRTLSHDEWDWIINHRSTDKSYLRANVNGHFGLILFPDDFCCDYSYVGNNTNGEVVNVTASDWSGMEAAGAVFLPAAGYRRMDEPGFPQAEYVHNIEEKGFYWAAGTGSSTVNGYRLIFRNNNDDNDNVHMGSYNRGAGFSVRLVRDAN